MTLIDGRKAAQALNDQAKKHVQELTVRGTHPCLAVVLVGDDPASHVYVRNKHQACKDVGIKTLDIKKPAKTTQMELIKIVEELNEDNFVHGILVQLPLPPHIDPETIFKHIAKTKDVDGFHPDNVGALVKEDDTAMIPCTPQGIVHLLDAVGKPLEGMHAVIIGRSHLVGRPLAQLLLQRDMTVTITHSKTRDLAKITNQADVLISAIGKPKFITAEYVKKGSIVIDVGINKDSDDDLVGDVDFDEVKNVASHITPVPGGVGPMTIACLIQNTLKAAA